MSLTNLKAIFFDLDGTLVDTVTDIATALNATLVNFNLAEIELALVRRLVGRGSISLLADCINHLAKYQQVSQWQNQAGLEILYQDFLQQYKLVNGEQANIYPQVVEGLTALQQHNFKLACITNKPLALAQQLLTKLNLASFFAVIYGGDSFSEKKPQALPLLKACAALAVEPAQALMVGDSINDAAAAKNAGCRCVLLPYGYNGGLDIDSLGAERVVANCGELSQLLMQSKGPSN